MKYVVFRGGRGINIPIFRKFNRAKIGKMRFQIPDVMRGDFSAKFKNQTLAFILFYINKLTAMKLATLQLSEFINLNKFSVSSLKMNSFEKGFGAG